MQDSFQIADAGVLQFFQMNKIYYLYVINFPNGKRYVGITCNLKRRLAVYKTHAHRGSNKQKVFNAIRKYRIENLRLEPLVVGTERYIRDLEKGVIALYLTRDFEYGYNQAIGGEMSPVAGIGHTEESKRKMSISQKKRVHTPEEIAKMAASLKGRTITPDHRRKLSEAAIERWSNVDERLHPKTLENVRKVAHWLKQGKSRKWIQNELGLSKPRVRGLVLQATNRCFCEPVFPED